jgi:RNA polymerase sigma-70 factor (ECF subfamily)
MDERDDGSGDDPLASIANTGDLESTVHLIERARAGDQAALNRLIARHLTPLRRWARGRLPKWARDMADTDDMVQDTLLQTFKRVGDIEVRGPGALLAYLRQAVLNRVRDELRRHGRRPEETALDGLEADQRRTPLEEAIGGEAIERYERALGALTPHDREAIIGRIEMGYSYQELAEALGKPSAEAARKAARRALVRLVRQMQSGNASPG